MSRYIRNPGVQIDPRTPENVQRALTGFNRQPVTTADQLEAARELGASYISTTPKGANMSTDRNADRSTADQTDRAEAAAAGRAAASVELGRELALEYMTRDQRKRAAELRARRDAAELE
jgi:hypothetical protein